MFVFIFLTAEKQFMTGVVLLSCFVFAYCMSSIGEILKDFGKQKQLFKEKLQSLNSYLEKRQLSAELRIKVRKYYEY